MDGVFSSNGEFAGPNERELFEEIVYPAEVCQQVGRVAREQSRTGLDSSSILLRVGEVFGKPQEAEEFFVPMRMTRKIDPEEFRQETRSSIAWQIDTMRKMRGAEETVQMLVIWADSMVPQYRRG